MYKFQIYQQLTTALNIVAYSIAGLWLAVVGLAIVASLIGY